MTLDKIIPSLQMEAAVSSQEDSMARIVGKVAGTVYCLLFQVYGFGFTVSGL